MKLKHNLSRRDFLKLSGLSLAGLFAPHLILSTLEPPEALKLTNIEAKNKLQFLKSENEMIMDAIQPTNVTNELVKFGLEIGVAQNLQVPKRLIELFVLGKISKTALTACAPITEPGLENQIITDSEWEKMEQKDRLLEIYKGNVPELWNNLKDQPIQLAKEITKESESIVFSILCESIGCDRRDLNAPIYTYTEEEFVEELVKLNYTQAEINNLLENSSALNSTGFEAEGQFINNSPIIRMDDELSVFYPDDKPGVEMIPAQIALLARYSFMDTMHEVTHGLDKPHFQFNPSEAKDLSFLFQHIDFNVGGNSQEVISVDAQIGPRIFITIMDPQTGLTNTTDIFKNVEEARRAYVDRKLLINKFDDNVANYFDQPSYIETANLFETLLNKINITDFNEWYLAHKTLPIDQLSLWYQSKAFEAGFKKFNTAAEGFLILNVINNMTGKLLEIEWDSNLSIEENKKNFEKNRKELEKNIEVLLNDPY